MSVAKKIWISSLVIVFVICLAINIWYFNLKFFGKQKLISTTYEVGLQTLKDAEGTTKYFVEVNSMADMFEIKFNYMLDENQTAFYSQGLQFMKGSNGKINFNFARVSKDQQWLKSSGWGLWKKDYYNRYLDGYLYSGFDYNYMSNDDYETCLNSTNPIGENSFFKIQIGKKLYGMKFKGHAGFNEMAYAGNFFVDWRLVEQRAYYYYSYDFIYFAQKLYNSIQSLPNGSNNAYVFEFADLFTYYEYDEASQSYSTEPVSAEYISILEKDVKSYYSILVTKTENKVTKANDSLFNCVAGNSGWTNGEDVTEEDYFIGRTTIDTTIYNFDFVLVGGNSYALKLNDKFISKWLADSDVIVLDVLIDLDFFTENNYEFVGFTNDSNLDKFKILRCRTVQTVNEELVYQEVSYV